MSSAALSGMLAARYAISSPCLLLLALLPVAAVPPSDVNLGIMLDQFSGIDSFQRSQLEATLLALDEINDKGDGVNDFLLPRTHLRIIYRDPQCTPLYAVRDAFDVTHSFNGTGVRAIVGAVCSGASKQLALVGGVDSVPIISASSTSPLLSNRDSYPYFMRVCPSDAFAATAIAAVLKNLLGYSKVVSIADSSTYATDMANTFVDSARMSSCGATRSCKVREVALRNCECHERVCRLNVLCGHTQQQEEVHLL